MPRTTVIALLMALSMAAGIEGQTKDLEKGAALLAEARKALGGEDRLRAIRTLDVRGDFTRLAGQTTIEGELQVRLELPDKLRRDEDLSPPGGGPAIVRTEVLNGTTVWDENSGGGRMFMGRFGGGGGGRGGAPAGPGGVDAQAGGRAQMDPARIEDAQRRARQTELARFALVWLLTTDSPAGWIGIAEAPDGKADVLEITPGTGPAMRLFLDASTHMPLMVTWQGAAPQLVIAGRRGARGEGRGDAPAGGRGPGGPPATLRVTLADYKTVNGVKLPHLMTRGANDMTLEEWTIDSYRINPTFRADVFTK